MSRVYWHLWPSIFPSSRPISFQNHSAEIRKDSQEKRIFSVGVTCRDTFSNARDVCWTLFKDKWLNCISCGCRFRSAPLSWSCSLDFRHALLKEHQLVLSALKYRYFCELPFSCRMKHSNNTQVSCNQGERIETPLGKESRGLQFSLFKVCLLDIM